MLRLSCICSAICMSLNREVRCSAAGTAASSVGRDGFIDPWNRALEQRPAPAFTVVHQGVAAGAGNNAVAAAAAAAAKGDDSRGERPRSRPRSVGGDRRILG